MPATEIYSSPAADILILYVPISDQHVNVLKPDFNKSDIRLAKTPVYAASFAAGYNFSVTPGFVTAFDGPVRPVVVPAWTTNVNYAEGQSGSPLVLEDGRVIAIVKGADAGGAAVGIVVPVMFIPSQYWDPQSTAVQTIASLPEGAKPTRITVSKTVVTSEPRQIVRAFTLTRNACEPQVPNTIHFTATSGSTIDPNSIELTIRSFTGKELRGSSVSNATPAGFDVTADIVPSGMCAPVLPSLVQALAARYVAEVRYREQPNGPQPQEVVVAQTAAVPGVDLPVGKSTQGLTFTIQQPTGAKATFVPSGKDLKTIGGQKVLDVAKVLSKTQF